MRTRDGHVDDALLEAFTLGELGERTATLVAEHLDACPACANRARLADPLADHFAAVADPVLPADLVPAILAADAARGGVPWTELLVAAALVSVAAGVAWSSVAASAWWGEATSLVRGLASAGAHAVALPGAAPTLAAATALAALGAWWLARGEDVGA